MRVTFKKLVSWIEEGRGLGAGDDYKPWEQITRNRSSPYSNQNVIPVPHLTRLAHFLSRGEREFGLLLWWLGAEDVREQYPLWPWPHTQPLKLLGIHGAGGDKHPGMVEVAREAGIKLGKYPGLNVPYVLTLDFVVTVPQEVAPHRLIGFSCKPKALFRAAKETDRLWERLQLDRLYCVAAGFPHQLVHPEQICQTLLVQLHWLAPIMPKNQLDAYLETNAYKSYVAEMKPVAHEVRASVASRSAAKLVGWSEEEGLQALQIAIWRQDLDVDLSQPLSMARALRSGGRSLRRRLRECYFGVEP